MNTSISYENITALLVLKDMEIMDLKNQVATLTNKLKVEEQKVLSLEESFTNDDKYDAQFVDGRVVVTDKVPAFDNDAVES